MKNPFTIIKAHGETFCNRQAEKEELRRYIENGQNVLLYAKRRYGKSSLVKETLSEFADRKDMITISLEIFKVSNSNDLVRVFATEIADTISKKAVDKLSAIEKLKSFLSRVNLQVGVSQDGFTFSVKLDPAAPFTALFDDVLAALYSYVTAHNLRVLIALDEFQEITELPDSKYIEGAIRQYMQENPRVNYIFVGSKRRILLDMFSGKSRPFYKSVFTMTLGEIGAEHFVPFIRSKFEATGKVCSEEMALKIFNAARAYPYYVQRLSYIVWELVDSTVTAEDVDQAFKHMLDMEAADYESIWEGLTISQKTLIKALAENPTAMPYSKAFLLPSGLAQSSAQKAMKGLLSKDVIEKDSGVFKLTDPIFGQWLVTRS